MTNNSNKILVIFVILIVSASIFLTWTSLNQTSDVEGDAIDDLSSIQGKVITSGTVGIQVTPQSEGGTT